MNKRHGSARRSLRVLALSCLLLSMAGLWHAFADETVAGADTQTAKAEPSEPQKTEQNKSAFRQLLTPRKPRPAGTNSGIALFGTVEFTGSLDALPKWKRVLTEMDTFDRLLSPALAKALVPQHSALSKTPVHTKGNTTHIYAGTATEQTKNTPAKSHTESGSTHIKAWKQFAASMKNKNIMEKLRAVNAYFNKWPYRLDMENWGVSDYWATPAEFVGKSGDCEDYSIIKYYALKELGIAPDTMRIVALRDAIRGIGHAVLVVYAKDDAWVLDNQTNLVLSHTRYGHYKPQYSVNETARWAHIPKQKKSLGSIFSQAKKKQQ